MSGSQIVIIAGNLAKDPEMRYTPAGTALCKLSIPTEESYIKDGEKVKETIWWNVSVWGKQAEACNNYLAKGSIVTVNGTVKARAYTDNAGKTNVSMDLNATHVQFLGGTKPAEAKPDDSMF